MANCYICSRTTPDIALPCLECKEMILKDVLSFALESDTPTDKVNETYRRITDTTREEESEHNPDQAKS